MMVSQIVLDQIKIIFYHPFFTNNSFESGELLPYVAISFDTFFINFVSVVPWTFKLKEIGGHHLHCSKDENFQTWAQDYVPIISLG